MSSERRPTGAPKGLVTAYLDNKTQFGSMQDMYGTSVTELPGGNFLGLEAFLLGP
jgi:hypothetical protein